MITVCQVSQTYGLGVQNLQNIDREGTWTDSQLLSDSESGTTRPRRRQGKIKTSEHVKETGIALPKIYHANLIREDGEPGTKKKLIV